MPEVSVVIPAFNVEAYLPRALASLEAQTVPPREVILVDDASEDGTREVAREFEQRYAGTFTLIESEHVGAAEARNLGTAEATGDYLQFLDSDDELLPTKLEHQLALLEAEDKPVDLIAAAFLKRYESGRPPEEALTPPSEDIWSCLILGQGAPGITSANLFRREAVVKCGGWNASRAAGQEAELMFRMLQQNAHTLIDPTPLTRKLQRNQGAIWSVDDRGPDKVAKMVAGADLRIEMLQHLANQGAVSLARFKAGAESLSRTLSRVARMDQAAAEAAKDRAEPFMRQLRDELVP